MSSSSLAHADTKICKACLEEKPKFKFGTVRGVQNASKVCKACNRRRSAMSYAKKHNKVFLKAEGGHIRDSNRKFFLQWLKHGIPFLLQDIYNDNNIIAVIRSDNWQHSFEVLEDHGIGQYYVPMKRLARTSIYKDRLTVADTITNMGFRVVRELEVGARYA